MGPYHWTVYYPIMEESQVLIPPGLRVIGCCSHINVGVGTAQCSLGVVHMALGVDPYDMASYRGVEVEEVMIKTQGTHHRVMVEVNQV